MKSQVLGSPACLPELRAIQMGAAQLYIVTILLIIGCQQASLGQEGPTKPGADNSASPEIDKQLNIYKTTLLEGKTEQIRIDAATMMLFSDSPSAREVLVGLLTQSEPSVPASARAAICKALIHSRASHKPIKNSEDFVEPLIQLLLAEEDPVYARLAAEATLIFKYEQVQKRFDQVSQDSSLPVQARLNVISALELHSDLRAVFRLMALGDDPDKQVAGAAERALTSLGITVSRDPEARKAIRRDLERLEPEAFLRECLIRQETEIRTLDTQLGFWRGRYIAILSDLYDTKADDASRSQFLAQQLAGTETAIKLWALDKLAEMRKGTDKPKLSPQLESILLDSISDQNRDVRLKTASLLSLMWEVKAAAKLLVQLKVEQDDQIRTELLVALGGTCYYASLPNSGVQIPVETKRETLEWAIVYLSKQDVQKARAGADVVRKLLEQNGLTPEEIDRYLNALAAKYAQLKGDPNGTLRAELLGAMAALCATRSACRSQAAVVFGPVFDSALADDADIVRHAAVDGIVNIDKVSALKRLRVTFVNDPSAAIRRSLIDLAGEVGGREELSWLADKLTAAGEGEFAWQALLKVFGRLDPAAMYEWVASVEGSPAQAKLSDEQTIALLQATEQKATTENKTDIRDQARRLLAESFVRRGQFQQAAGYLGLLRQSATTKAQKEAVLSDLLNVYLKLPEYDLTARLLRESLLEADLGPDSHLIQSLDAYFNNPPAGLDAAALLRALTAIELKGDDRPIWRKHLKIWSGASGSAPEPPKADSGAKDEGPAGRR